MADVKKSKLKNIETGISGIRDACVVLARTEWNAAIVDELVRGCTRILEEQAIKKIITITVPGAVEIPFAIRRYQELSSRKNKADAFIALGCVIRGDTPHFDYVCNSVTDGVTLLNQHLPVPVIMGVLTVNDEQQALDRIGGKQGHKGEEAALTALKMIAFNRSLKK